MSLAFVEHLFKERGQDFRKHADGRLDADFKGYDQSHFIMGFTEIQRNVAQGQVWFPSFDRTVNDILGLCSFINNQKIGLVLEFDQVHNRLGTRAYFEKTSDAYQEIGNFVIACDLGLRPLSIEVSARGYWTYDLVHGYMTFYTRSKLN